MNMDNLGDDENFESGNENLDSDIDELNPLTAEAIIEKGVENPYNLHKKQLVVTHVEL